MAGTVAAAGMAFNLICSGSAYTVQSLMGPRQNVRSFEETYRVDLAKQRWCKEACIASSELAQVTPTTIVFERDERGVVDDTVTFVNRESGRFVHRVRLQGFTDLWEGQCRKAQFTGFPARKF